MDVELKACLEGIIDDKLDCNIPPKQLKGIVEDLADQVNKIKSVLQDVCVDDVECKKKITNAFEECFELDSERPVRSGGSSDAAEITPALVEKILDADVNMPRCIIESFPPAKRSMSTNTEAELSTLLRKIKRMLEKQ